MKILSEEHKQNISKAIRGDKHPMYGKHHPDKTRRRISEARKLSGSSKGEKNNFFGVRYCGEDSPTWTGGRSIASTGYVKIWISPRKYKYEHQAIAEKVLGRELRRGELIHHINMNKTDNRNSNLLICSIPYHQELHNKMAMLYAKEHLT